MIQSSEKRGNTHWAQCPACQGWLHLSNALLAKPAIALHCPHCQREFLQTEAARLSRAQ